MIISASRRTDIPAFYAEWLIRRIRIGHCTVPNPFNKKQISYVSLLPEDVEIIVFWTRNPSPLMPYLKELDERGHHYYFQYTLLNNPRPLETKTPPISSALSTFKKLSDLIGPEKVIWRYDPIVFSSITDVHFHVETYKRISDTLQGYTYRSVISIMDFYRKMKKRKLEEQGIEFMEHDEEPSPKFDELMYSFAQIAKENEMEIVSCAETINLSPYGIRPGKCIDDAHIREVFGVNVTHKKDKSQRKECGCVISKDIGMYNSCLFGCQYCYATTSFEKAKINNQQHDPHSPSLLGWYEAAKK